MTDEKQPGATIDLKELRRVAEEAKERELKRQREENPGRWWANEGQVQDAILLAVAHHTADQVRRVQSSHEAG